MKLIKVQTCDAGIRNIHGGEGNNPNIQISKTGRNLTCYLFQTPYFTEKENGSPER